MYNASSENLSRFLFERVKQAGLYVRMRCDKWKQAMITSSSGEEQPDRLLRHAWQKILPLASVSSKQGPPTMATWKFCPYKTGQTCWEQSSITITALKNKRVVIP